MAKKINSEFNIKSNSLNFNIKMGTSNKKNPEVIYTTLTSYITPLNDYDYNIFLSVLNKGIKKYIKTINAIKNKCERDLIVIVDIATNRLEIAKPSYLDIQIYLKPTNEVKLRHKYNFKNISEELYDNYIHDTIKYIEKTLSEYNYVVSKTKNKTIYTKI